MNHPVICKVGLFFTRNILAEEPPQPQTFNIENFCKTYTGQSNFISDMKKKIFSNTEYTEELIHLISEKKATGCYLALNNYFNKIIEIDGVLDQYLLLAFASHLRTQYDAQLRDESSYGKPEINGRDFKIPEFVIPIGNPTFINKYMSEIIRKKIELSKSNFSDLNIIYAAANQSYREIFLNQMSAVASISPAHWIASFRTEPVWVQFRLLPIMKKIKGGFIKRELIWLSQHHQNPKIRSVAATLLEEVNNTTNQQQ